MTHRKLITQMLKALENSQYDNGADSVNELYKAIDAAHEYLAAPEQLEPVGWATHHDEPMLFPTWREAAMHCDDGEEPIALYAAPPSTELTAYHHMTSEQVVIIAARIIVDELNHAAQRSKA